jgi:hypothetical protein
MVRRPTVKLPDSSFFRGWLFVVVLGVFLAVVALVHRGGVEELAADGSTGCQLEVTTERLNVRSEPRADAELIEMLERADRVDATRVVTNGFRELEEGRWASNEFLTPLPGSDC